MRRSRNLRERIRRLFFDRRYGKQTILIYTMGKVGSSTVQHNLHRQYPEATSFHVHFLSDYWLREKLPAEDPFFHSNIREAEVVLDFLRQHKDRRLKIITLVREPLVRDISDIFQNWKGRLKDKTITDLSFEELKNGFNSDNHEYTLSWFDTEFRNYLGFDIYAQPFDKEKGYSIYHTPSADILCLQLEKLNDCLPQATQELLGYAIRPERSANLSEEKEGSELYKEMTGRYAAPEEKLDRVYGSKFMRHFYSEEDIRRFRRKWERVTS